MKLKSPAFPRRIEIAALAACLLWWSGTARPAEEARPARTVRLLTVGNSFSANATHYLGDLARASGDVLVHRPIVVGGASLELHAEKARRHERDPSDKQGLYANGRSLKQELQSDRWDFVTIQQASIKSHDVATYRPFAQSLADCIRQHAPGAELVMHETWEYRVDDPRFSVKKPAPGEPATQDAMYDGLRRSYETIARELGVRLIPVGDAFHRVNHDPKWAYHPPGTPFDPESARPGEVPDQTHSLNVGWSWKKQTDGRMKPAMDGHHANMAGEYLGACVWYEFLFGRSVVGNSFVPKGLDAGFARHLQETAHDVVNDAKAQPK